jgi:hypothetical protein
MEADRTFKRMKVGVGEYSSYRFPQSPSHPFMSLQRYEWNGFSRKELPRI